jgi:hypothetical protein
MQQHAVDPLRPLARNRRLVFRAQADACRPLPVRTRIPHHRQLNAPQCRLLRRRPKRAVLLRQRLRLAIQKMCDGIKPRAPRRADLRHRHTQLLSQRQRVHAPPRASIRSLMFSSTSVGRPRLSTGAASISCRRSCSESSTSRIASGAGVPGISPCSTSIATRASSEYVSSP